MGPRVLELESQVYYYSATAHTQIDLHPCPKLLAASSRWRQLVKRGKMKGSGEVPRSLRETRVQRDRPRPNAIGTSLPRVETEVAD